MADTQRQIATALARPIFDPQRDIDARYFWFPERLTSAGLTCNIGME